MEQDGSISKKFNVWRALKIIVQSSNKSRHCVGTTKYLIRDAEDQNSLLIPENSCPQDQIQLHDNPGEDNLGIFAGLVDELFSGIQTYHCNITNS